MEQENGAENAIDLPHEGIRRKRSVWIAFLLSFLTPGIGQIYNDQSRKGLIFITVIYLFLTAASLCGLFDMFSGLVAVLVTETSFRIYIMCDAVKVARNQEVIFPLPSKQQRLKWTLAVSILLVMFFADWKLITGHQTFIIPSTGNEPTIFVDDRIMVDMRYYDSHDPTYGDIVVYLGEDGMYYCSRVVALPGDRFQLKDDIPSVNGVAAMTEYICDTVSGMMTNVKKYQEILPGQHKHFLLLSDEDNEAMIKTMEEIIVPTDHYFLLSDNRDNALDSRFRGPIHRVDIRGKCLYTFWGATANRINVSLK